MCEAWQGQLGQLLYPFQGATLDQNDIPRPLNSHTIDWRKSCFKEPWPVERTGITSPKQCHVRIEVSNEDVARILLERSHYRSTRKLIGVSRSKSQRPKRGRPAEYNWPAVKTRLASYAAKHGPIQALGELLQKCADFAFELHPGKKTPSDKTIREAIARYDLDKAAREKPKGKMDRNLKP